MGGKNVKNTIVERVLQNIAPHYCCGCGKVGGVLCLRCKHDITEEPFVGCFVCGAASRSGICTHHVSAISRSFIVSERAGAIQTVIDAFKFQHMKAAARELADLLDARLPLLPINTVLVPIPTVRSHVRQRGYDQVELIAQQLSSIRHLPVARLIRRMGHETQHTLGRRARQVAARQAFSIDTSVTIPRGSVVLLIDDIITTGATIESAARTLSPLGIPILAAAIAYQPLD